MRHTYFGPKDLNSIGNVQLKYFENIFKSLWNILQILGETESNLFWNILKIFEWGLPNICEIFKKCLKIF